MKGRTRDGISLDKILELAETEGIGIRKGKKHPYLLKYQDQKPCPVAESSHFRHMILPWLKKVTGYSNESLYALLGQY